MTQKGTMEIRFIILMLTITIVAQILSSVPNAMQPSRDLNFIYIAMLILLLLVAVIIWYVYRSQKIINGNKDFNILTLQLDSNQYLKYSLKLLAYQNYYYFLFVLTSIISQTFVSGDYLVPFGLFIFVPLTIFFILIDLIIIPIIVWSVMIDRTHVRYKKPVVISALLWLTSSIIWKPMFVQLLGEVMLNQLLFNSLPESIFLLGLGVFPLSILLEIAFLSMFSIWVLQHDEKEPDPVPFATAFLITAYLLGMVLVFFMLSTDPGEFDGFFLLLILNIMLVWFSDNWLVGNREDLGRDKFIKMILLLVIAVVLSFSLIFFDNIGLHDPAMGFYEMLIEISIQFIAVRVIFVSLYFMLIYNNLRSYIFENPNIGEFDMIRPRI